MVYFNSKASLPLKIDTSFDGTECFTFIDNSLISFKQLLEQHRLTEKKVCIITDENVYRLYGDYLSENLNGIEFFWYTLVPGEFSKSDVCCLKIIKFLLENNFNRDDFLIAFGGGVVTDITGFAAAIYKRGISFISIPTSLVAMTDSAIGGKNGINFEGFKNEIGTFNSPLFVYINTNFIKTLTIEQIADGMVEIIKTALVLDGDFFEFLYDNLNLIVSKGKPRDYSEIENIFFSIIYNSVLIKANVICDDPFDYGKRHLLNFGHTIGHAIEKCSNYCVTHGQAVSIGIICALNISLSFKLADASLFDKVKEMFMALTLPVSIYQIIDKCRLDSCMADLEENILYYIGKDKKQTSVGLKFILLEGPGRGIICNGITEEDILGSF